MRIDNATLDGPVHQRILDWQARELPEINHLQAHWDRFYPGREPFRVCAKLGPLADPAIEVGPDVGRPKAERVRDLSRKQVEQYRQIMRAQASTELGGVQLHRLFMEEAGDDQDRFDILRLAAEEFRHGYQMIWLLASDDWADRGVAPVDELIEELLSMRIGTHVLDAFNLRFDSFLDSLLHAALVDRVGKWQLTMQSVFAYAPFARSMGPMLKEEAFHLVYGVGRLKHYAVQAVRGDGRWSIELLQQHLNKWYPRALDMFGDERGGRTNIELGFKTLTNKQAAAGYAQEVQEKVVDALNVAVVKEIAPGIPPRDAAAVAARVVSTGLTERGVPPHCVFYLPDPSWFRRKGIHAYAHVDVDGTPLSALAAAEQALAGNLPATYRAHPDFAGHLDAMRRARSSHAF